MGKLWNFEDLPFNVRIRLKQPFDRELFKNIDVGMGTRDYWIKENSFPLKIIRNSQNYEEIKPLITHIKQNNGQFWVSINCIQKITTKLARVLARMAGDGSVNSYGEILYGNLDKGLIDSFVEDMKFLFPNIKPHIRYLGEVHMYQLLFNAVCGSLLRFIFGEFGTYNVRIPKQIMKSNKKIKASYLQAFFDDEGSVNCQAHQITFYTVNKGLAKDIQFLLREFNIKNTLFKDYHSKNTKKVQYRIHISHRDNIEKFAVYIGFDKKSIKVKKLSNLLQSYPNYQKYHISCLKLLLDGKPRSMANIRREIKLWGHTEYNNLCKLMMNGLVSREIISRKVKPWSITQKGREYYQGLSFYH